MIILLNYCNIIKAVEYGLSEEILIEYISNFQIKRRKILAYSRVYTQSFHLTSSANITQAQE